MNKLYSNEIVFRGHPDKVCDQISSALLQAYVNEDKKTKAGIEVMGGKGKIFITGEVTSNAKNVDVEKVAKRILRDIGYDESKYEVVNNIGKQSHDIAMGLTEGGAGDQGMMFGYACNETNRMLPKAMVFLQELSKAYDKLVHERKMFLPDGKAQVTGLYDDDFRLIRIESMVVSYQNTEESRTSSDSILYGTIMEIAEKYHIDIDRYNILFNPTGKFLIGGFEGDAGLTGRKIVVDSYHSFANVGGGAYSGKDMTKVDVSGAYKARQIACRMLNVCNLQWCEVQLSYVIGVCKPAAIYIDSDIGNIEPSSELYVECEPSNIIKDLRLLESDYEQLAKFGHFTDVPEIL